MLKVGTFEFMETSEQSAKRDHRRPMTPLTTAVGIPRIRLDTAMPPMVEAPAPRAGKEKNADEHLETTVKATISKAYDKGLNRGTKFMTKNS